MRLPAFLLLEPAAGVSLRRRMGAVVLMGYRKSTMLLGGDSPRKLIPLPVSVAR